MTLLVWLLEVEHMLNDRLLPTSTCLRSRYRELLFLLAYGIYCLFYPCFIFVLWQEARKRFDKASLLYDQACEKFLSLRKGTKTDVATLLEEELHSAWSAFEQACFNLVTTLSNVEAKKRFEFLEAVRGTMDAHLRYFKQGYELLHQLEPYINQVLTYAQQSRERSNNEQAALNERMQEYKRQIDRESRWSSNGCNGSPNGDGIQAIGRSSHKMIEAVHIVHKFIQQTYSDTKTFKYNATIHWLLDQLPTPQIGWLTQQIPMQKKLNEGEM
ncbi:hypothetical protein K2173_016880 [Erythroxylum novogranatense]|uniref:BAR domain-containing protein n=1 Tax=Erythroxylum novogranatense TaxID=1862640 RepID=A0AAV8U8M8_9ROSI|nr:hypothetical protein K2173_016880 [Erythroxylum novogranatense]